MNKFVRHYKELAEQNGIEGTTRESMRWFKNIIAQQKGNLNISEIKRGYSKPPRVLAGQMITYIYSAKNAATLPYWDRYPLVYVLEVTRTGWTGINVHYLHPMQRMRLFSRNFFNNVYIENEISRPAMKRYLANRVVGKLVEIPLEDWQIMIYLPYEKFSGAVKTQAWKDSRRKM